MGKKNDVANGNCETKKVGALYTAGARHIIPRGVPSVIGNHVQNAVHINDVSVSQNHAKIGWIDNDVFICDTDSTHGTKLKTIELTSHIPVYLAHGSHLMFGRIGAYFKYEEQDERDASGEQPAVRALPIENSRFLRNAIGTLESSGDSFDIVAALFIGPVRIVLKRGEIATIGGSASSKIIIETDSLKLACIDWLGDNNLVIYSCDKTYATHLNGKKLALHIRYPLRHKDVIDFGRVTAIYQHLTYNHAILRDCNYQAFTPRGRSSVPSTSTTNWDLHCPTNAEELSPSPRSNERKDSDTTLNTRCIVESSSPSSANGNNDIFSMQTQIPSLLKSKLPPRFINNSPEVTDRFIPYETENSPTQHQSENTPVTQSSPLKDGCVFLLDTQLDDEVTLPCVQKRASSKIEKTSVLECESDAPISVLNRVGKSNQDISSRNSFPLEDPSIREISKSYSCLNDSETQDCTQLYSPNDAADHVPTDPVSFPNSPQLIFGDESHKTDKNLLKTDDPKHAKTNHRSSENETSTSSKRNAHAAVTGTSSVRKNVKFSDSSTQLEKMRTRKNTEENVIETDSPVFDDIAFNESQSKRNTNDTDLDDNNHTQLPEDYQDTTLDGNDSFWNGWSQSSLACPLSLQMPLTQDFNNKLKATKVSEAEGESSNNNLKRKSQITSDVLSKLRKRDTLLRH